MDRFKEHQKKRNGVGGIDCVCCTKGSRRFHKRYTKKRARRDLKLETERQADEAILEVVPELE